MEPQENSAFAALEAGLREALKHRGIDDRKAAGLALGAVVNLFHDALPHLTAQNLHMPLFDLLAALQDLEQGRVAPMLRPTQFGNRPPASQQMQMARGFATFTVRQLMAGGATISEACQRVCVVWNQRMPKAQRKANTIRSWYGHFAQLSDDSPVRAVYTALQQEAESDPQVAAGDPLQKLGAVLGQIGRGCAE
jgi:hypothetical protein